MQYHEVKVNIEFRDAQDCFWYAENPQAYVNGVLTPTANKAWAGATHWDTIYGHHVTVGDFTASLWVDYIYLDTDERRRFAQVSHEYLLFNKRSKATTRQYADTVGAKTCRQSVKPYRTMTNVIHAPMAICCC